MTNTLSSAIGSYASPPRRNLDGSRARIDLLARGFLVGAARPEPGFSYYCYLLFADRGGDNLPARRAAANSYLSLLSDVEEARKSSNPSNMAILLAPMREQTDTARLQQSRDAQLFLDSYNYDRARVLVSSLTRNGKTVPRVAIVGYRRPLEGAAVIPENAAIADLDLRSDNEIERRILKLQQDLVAGVNDVQDGEKQPFVLRKLRKVFELVGITIGDLASVAS